MQSCFQCIPIKCIIGKESTDFLQEQLGELYKFFVNSSMSGKTGTNVSIPEWEPFSIACPADQKADQKLECLAKGSTVKIKENFCPYCIMHMRDINEANQVPCEYCTFG